MDISVMEGATLAADVLGRFQTIAYILAALLFILALAGLSQQKTALRGNTFGIVGMALAFVATIAIAIWQSSGVNVVTIGLIAIALLIGGAIGARKALTIPMTGMPELVAMLHSFVGIAAVLIALWLLSLSSSREGLSFKGNKGFWAMAVSVLTGVASAMWDKHIMPGMQPLFVQSWTNIYITLLLGAVILIRSLHGHKEKLRLHWTLPVIAILITGADMLYFFALKQDGAMLSVISLVRRASVIITFALGALVFKERRIAQKAGVLALMLAGLVLLVVFSI